MYLNVTIGNEVVVGKIIEYGSIHFNWEAVNVIDDDTTDLTSVKQAVGRTFCNEKEIMQYWDLDKY